MHSRLRCRSHIVIVALLRATSAIAQTSSPPTGSTAVAPTTESTRPATTTFDGDTGLWFVPSANVLPHAQVSLSGYRRGTNYVQGYTNVADFASTFAVGFKGRAEFFGSFIVDTRIDRDVRPLFVNDATWGGVVDRYPNVATTWTGNELGDFSIGAKLSLWSESRRNPAALAVRGIVKLPTGDASVSTGKPDVRIDFVTSKDVRQSVEIAAYTGYELVGSPPEFDLPGGAFRWGVGAAFPSRGSLRVLTELHGRVHSSDTVTTTTADQQLAGIGLPSTSAVQNLTVATAGVTYQAPNGVFVGTGVSWYGPSRARDLAYSSDNPAGDYWDWQVRIGYYHRAPRIHTAAPPAPAAGTVAAPAAPTPPQNRPPTVRAQCDPCAVAAGTASALTADASDPDGDILRYQWTAATGTLASPTTRQTAWTAPQQAGAVQVTVTVSDGKGGFASDFVTLQVIRPVTTEYAFEDVHFDFDRYSLRPEAARVLDEAVSAFRTNPSLRVTIEGHTCNIGTSEYNLALGNRRASAVRDYLVMRGVAPDRLLTISYGEERPKFDNGREETRRLNRRAALVVRLEP